MATTSDERNYLEQELYDLIKKDSVIFDFIQKSSLDGLWYWDLENPENEWMNETFWQTLGYDPKAMPHKVSAWQNIIHPDDLELAVGNFQKHCEDPNYPYDQVVRYKSASGGTVWIRCKGLVIRDDSGKPLRMLGAHVDISAQKESEFQLKDRVERYDQIIDSAEIGTWEWNPQSGELIYNKMWKNILGYVENEIPGTLEMWTEYTHPDDLVSSQLKRHFDGESPKFQCETRFRHKKGHWVWVFIRGSVIERDKEGRPLWLRGKLSDISERKKASERVKKLLEVTQAQNKRLVNFTNIVSHNLRSHSSNLSMLLDILKQEKEGFEDDEFYPMLEEAVRGLGSTVENLDEVISVQTTNKDQHQLSIHQFVESAIQNIRALAREADVSFRNETNPKHFVLGVPAYLESVLINLLTNSIKYRSPDRQGLVVVSSGSKNGTVEFTVEDNGLGIDLEKNGNKIFGMNRTFHGNKDARGFGLFLTKNHVEAMGGTIGVESKVGEGSKFTIKLNRNEV